MDMKVNVIDISAILGALAWIPHLVGWIYGWFIKPVVTITPDKIVELGYTTFGPLFNLRLSINVNNKDTLIDFVGVEIQHEKGAKYYLEWSGMIEHFSEVTSNKGESQIIQRNIVPISIKLSTLSLIERFFRFQDPSFIKNNKIELEKLDEKQQYMKNQDKNYYNGFLNSKEFEDYLKFMRANFYWQQGEYIVRFVARSPEKIKLKMATYKFHLTQANIDKLLSNIEEIKKEHEYAIRKTDVPQYSIFPADWRWLTVELHKI